MKKNSILCRSYDLKVSRCFLDVTSYSKDRRNTKKKSTILDFSGCAIGLVW